MTSKNIYGSKGWARLWKKLEQEGNVGINYFINPYLYPEITHFLQNNPDSVVVDFGAGTNILGIEYIFGYKDIIPGLFRSKKLEIARDNIFQFVGLEGEKELVERGKGYLNDIGNPAQISVIQHNLVKGNRLPFKKGSIDLAISRNFLMHLSLEDLDYHFQQVRRVLKEKGKYIFAILNPEYELSKFTESGKFLLNGKLYNFPHGSKGEHGTFYHYFKTLDYYMNLFKKFDFKILKKIECKPLNNKFKKTHPRYYQKRIPMGLVFVLER